MDGEEQYNSPEYQARALERQKEKCIQEYGDIVANSTLKEDYVNGTYCHPVWDEILCWPGTQANTMLSQPCPLFIAGFDRPNNATRYCAENGEWFVHPQTNNSWTNFSQCFTAEYATVVMEFENTLNGTIIEEYMPVIKIISKIGYSVSLSTLVVAFIIMISFKKLHCARNKLHMHLFLSFIFRASMALLKDMLFIKGVGFASDVLDKNGKSYFVAQPDSNNWGCKLFTSLWQYFITANYSWILMEGLYLHNLILLALFSDHNNSIMYYIVLGWGLPALVVGPWIIARLTLDDTLCWMTHASHPSMFLMIRVPTMISILINLVLFINIARVLLIKLRSPVSEEAQRYRRWVKSTLVLVPLFGVHYAAFLGMSTQMGLNERVELIWLFCDQLFACFQGFFVAILYCFLNGEVRAELCPRIKSFMSKWLSVPCCQYIFNCGDFSRSLKGRASVCTTLSCSSLYNSHGLSHKFQNRKGRWNAPQQSAKHKNFLSQEKHDLCHTCESNNRICNDQWNPQQNVCSPSSCIKCSGANCFCANSIVPVTEMTACLDHGEDTKQDLEMITMVNEKT